MSERCCFAIINGRDVYATTLELVDKCPVVIGTHTCPTSILDFPEHQGLVPVSSVWLYNPVESLSNVEKN